ncbi:B3 domain-containing transcription factor VRN1 isoform X3 [Rosa chinensis]|uniref:B3 domain-containing transcription factor VRN1 isoform X3 n=1 Tax=Rosa chinensis TaxID=74649 RepID=UPI000D09147F|nr:B3 domain-containing transcription factor VRN1 isoform X3 [Rosa chinensis]
MASSYLRRKCDDHRPRSSSTTPRRFLTVISDDTSRDRKLGIPKSFLDKYGEDLSNLVYFKLPCGPEWEIGLTSYNKEVWFRKGWPEFSKFHSLEKGYSLLFGYEGDSRFQVSIFDGSNNMEIDYTTSMLESEEGDQDDDISLEISEDVRRTALSHKQNRTVLSPKAEINVNFEERVKKETHWSKSDMKTGKHDFPAKRDGGGTSSTQRCRKQTPRVFRRAKSYKRSFKVPMHSSYIIQKNLWLPKTFVQTHLLMQPSNAILQVSGRRKTWPVKLTYEETKGRAKFQSGWTNFVRDKNIKDGDVCEFVLIDSNRLVFEVRINTANRTLSPDIDDGDDEDDEDEDEDEEDSDDESIEILDHFPPHLKRKEKSPLASKIHKRMRPSSRTQKFTEGGPEVPRKMPGPVMASYGKYIALQRANGFKSANPDFRISLHSSYITGHYLYLPAKFANRYLVKQPRHAILRVASKRTWSVNLRYTAARTTFQTGWFEFVQDNDLKEGGACIFMLTDNIQVVFDVVFFRAT